MARERTSEVVRMERRAYQFREMQQRMERDMMEMREAMKERNEMVLSIDNVDIKEAVKDFYAALAEAESCMQEISDVMNDAVFGLEINLY